MDSNSKMICNSMGSHGLDMQIAKQCAPLLMGIKISNILITYISNRERVNEIFKNTLKQVKCIYSDGERIVGEVILNEYCNSWWS